MERKLAEFRARRRETKDVDSGGAMEDQSKAQPESSSLMSSVTKTNRREEPEKAVSSPVFETTGNPRASTSWLTDSAVGRWLGVRRLAFTNVTLLKALLWLVLLGLFAELEFGLPFFLISLFYWLYEGLRSPAERRPGELSAYSVFNPDCQPILGTITAQQLEGEMGYGVLANSF
ncbi:hypothetical protein AAFF_G00320850 [Aldrovandia affinis]|uniref:SAYSvFN domain-containing protein n=1 Tax=Aldrovandia affinis TaxID=143900 RepID=A0AAD7R7L1_9TELE|nr:hypothetical protein AAFF_G00320850 [Aldrovandia affinis]